MELTPQDSSFSSGNSTPETEPRRESFVGEIVRFSIIALLIVLPIRMFVAQPFIVSGASMDDTFATGQYLIVDQLTYHFENPQRGDVIVFRYPRDTSKFFIKRVIGLPGDTIKIDGSKVTIINKEYPKGVVLYEPYILSMTTTSKMEETLGPGEYFVMGDNRDASSDSRMWGILPRQDIIGRTFLRLFPLNTIGLFPGDYNENAHLISSSSN